MGTRSVFQAAFQLQVSCLPRGKIRFSQGPPVSNLSQHKFTRGRFGLLQGNTQDKQGSSMETLLDTGNYAWDELDKCLSALGRPQ